ncbi:band 4.1-like protein 3 [Apodemus sylvaticus]|uniref:band 4.1-like protein 3 n=1 Tax=Apodemus sylvaticus TaxID=10129 RepID=UPI002243E33C|nr:band 4.1-like protein 3 [Apodemus sylvaticus]
MCPLSPLMCCTSSPPPYLLPVLEVDVLSDISEEDPFGEADQTTLDSFELLSVAGTSEQGDSEAATLESAPEPVVAPPQPDGPSVHERTLRLAVPKDADPGCVPFPFHHCFASGFPSLLDEDGYLALPSLPTLWVSFLPAGVQHRVPITSPSFIPSLILSFGLLLSASQSVAFSLTLSLPLALALCYLEGKATALHVFYDCDLNDKPEEEEAVTSMSP